MSTGLHGVVEHHIVNTLGWPELRPLQEAAVSPVVRGDDCLLVAPTAGGKTEAAFFPLLTRMADEGWRGLSVLYVCPLRALLNNLYPRISSYCSWIGVRAGLWHGDTPDSQRRRMVAEPPEVLLTTPESLEAMLVSTRVDAVEHFANLRSVIVDEVHAFAGDDRGWHLLAVLERLSRLAGRPLQRVGASATVGNPELLLNWLQGSAGGRRPATVVSPSAEVSAPTDVALDYVGSVRNAAAVIAALHRGEKRLVFCDSRRRVEELGTSLRSRGVETFVSHSSLSADERRRSEQAFAEARDCVIVATSTLELGIDVGDLDRVIQVDPPPMVASFLQRLGRTGRRPGTTRNCLFLATSDESLLQAAGLLRLWLSDWVEPIEPPASPGHIAAQQVLALCLQEGQVGQHTMGEWWNGLQEFDDLDIVVAHLLRQGFVEDDGEMLFIGPQAEKAYGRRNFMDLTSVFTAEPSFVVIQGRAEVGTVHPLALTQRLPDGDPRIILLGGRTWRVTHIDWRRHRCFVEEAREHGRARWRGTPQPIGYEVCQSMRVIVRGQDPGVTLSQRAAHRLGAVRESMSAMASNEGTVIVRDGRDDVHWWTWAGGRANATLAAALPTIVHQSQRWDNLKIRLDGDAGRDAIRAALRKVAMPLDVPPVTDEALRGLKFADALPDDVAREVLGLRSLDSQAALHVLQSSVAWAHS